MRTSPFRYVIVRPPVRSHRLTLVVFQVVGANGSGSISYETALTAVFLEGLIFILLALTGMRQWLVKLIPSTIKTATGVGIGLFLTEIGLSYSAGIGAITGGWVSTPLALGGCPAEQINSQTGMCDGGEMSNPKVCGCPKARETLALIKSMLISLLALVGRLLWRNHNRLLDGVPCQVCAHPGHCICFSAVLAVRPHLLLLHPALKRFSF